jgi:hypothetical protein
LIVTFTFSHFISFVSLKLSSGWLPPPVVPVVAPVVAVGLMLVAIYASRVFVAPAHLASLFLIFPSHDLTYVFNVSLSFGLVPSFFLYDIRPG